MQITASKTKKCPFCSETIRAAAVKCRYCAEFLTTDRPKTGAAESASDSGLPANETATDKILFEARPSLWALTGTLIKGLVLLTFAVCLMVVRIENIADNLFELELTDSQAIAFAQYRHTAGLALAALVMLVLLIKAVNLKMIYYEVSAERIEFSRGILDRRVDNLDMFRVIDLKMRRTLFDCIVGVGRVWLTTTDKSDPQFIFEKVRNSRRLYDIIKMASLDADRRNSVIHLE